MATALTPTPISSAGNPAGTTVVDPDPNAERFFHIVVTDADGKEEIIRRFLPRSQVAAFITAYNSLAYHKGGWAEPREVHVEKCLMGVHAANLAGDDSRKGGAE